MNKSRNWALVLEDGIAILTFDHKDSSQNVLSSEVMQELDEMLDDLEPKEHRGLIIKSAKENGFIVGADINEFTTIKSIDEAHVLLKKAHSLFNRIESWSAPTVAQINGTTLGGGLELALACRYRVAVDDPGCRLGLPEVKLGIHPGFGGTVRLSERIGVPAAMELMLSGRTLAARQAKKMGFIDLCVPKRQLERSALYLLEKQPEVSRPKLWLKLLQPDPVRKLMAGYLKKQVAKRASPDHYPAPYALIELWRQYGADRERMLVAEQKSISKLLLSPTSRNLVRVFFLQEKLKKIGKSQQIERVKRLHVIGSGVMGGDIAAWSALRGLTVTIHDQSHEALARATKRAYQLFKKKLRHPRLVQAAMDRFQPDIKGCGAGSADMIIEAIVEDAEAKIAVFSQLQQVAREDAILATNTSSIPIETISRALDKPGRLIGIHFFNPVAKMQLVEIVNGEKTFNTTSKRAASFTRQIDRLPVMVKSSSGFLVNRILMPYLLEAVELFNEGVPGQVIDKAAKQFGMPMGPVTLADTVGLDICYHVAENLTQTYGGKVPDGLKEKIDKGDLGKKTGQGFYSWHKGRPQKEKLDSDYKAPVDITDRMILRYLNEAVACLREGIVESVDHLDAGLIFGTGFAPFRGGPMQYIREQGDKQLLKKLNELQEKYGERFKANSGWNLLEQEDG